MTMIERVAREIMHVCPDSVVAEDVARAAIVAMREPTEAMISARFNVLGKGGQTEWQAMIDAALNEESN